MSEEKPSETIILAERLMLPAVIRDLYRLAGDKAVHNALQKLNKNLLETFEEYSEKLDAHVYTPTEARNKEFYDRFRGLILVYEPIFLDEFSYVKDLTNSQIDRILEEIEKERTAAEEAERCKKHTG